MSKDDLRVTHEYSKELGFINRNEAEELCEIAYWFGLLCERTHDYRGWDKNQLINLYRLIYAKWLYSDLTDVWQFLDDLDWLWVEIAMQELGYKL